MKAAAMINRRLRFIGVSFLGPERQPPQLYGVRRPAGGETFDVTVERSSGAGELSSTRDPVEPGARRRMSEHP
jgi:hypothetical protein